MKAGTIFVGGPRHGGAIDDDESAVFTDIVSGTVYIRKPIQMTLPHPVTGRPEWTYERTVFVAQGLTEPVFLCHDCGEQVPQAHANTAGSIGHRVERREPANMVFAGSQDAIMRYWFTSGGERRKAVGAAPGTAGSNGAGTAGTDTLRVVYTSVCNGCGDDGTSTGPRKMAFATLKDRAEWAADHIRTTGHELEFGEEPAP
jgi:hypothetical protein